MAIDTTPSQVATDALGSLPFGTIIGGPLKACIEAQAMSARTTWDFIRDVGIQVDPVTQEQKIINVSFMFIKNGRMAQLNVPLLTIVQVPYIAIHSMGVNFKANISALSSNSSLESTNQSKEAGASGNGTLSLGLFKASATFNANYSSKKDSKATQDSRYCVEYTMDVDLRAEQDDMPVGLAKILELLGNSLEVTEPEGTLEVSDLILEGEKGDRAKLAATYKNREGLYEPHRLQISGAEGKVQGNAKVFMLNIFEDETVYTVQVSGISKKVDVLTRSRGKVVGEKEQTQVLGNSEVEKVMHEGMEEKRGLYFEEGD